VRLFYTDRAEQELFDIWAYIAAENLSAADHVLDMIESTCNMLADFPKLGPVFSPVYRYVPVGRYLIIYKQTKNAIEISRVVHGARYLPGIM